MALGNFIISGSYTVVSPVIYDKQKKMVLGDVVTFRDSTKVEVINKASLQFCSPNISETLLGVSETPPVSPEEGGKWGVKANATGAWSGKGGYVAVSSGGEWQFYRPSDYQKFYIAGVYYAASSTDFHTVPGDDVRIFDAYFTVSAQAPADTTLLTVIYNFLKLKPEFSGCTDV